MEVVPVYICISWDLLIANSKTVTVALLVVFAMLIVGSGLKIVF